MDINFTDLEKLIKLAERSDIRSLEVTDGETRISIVCQPTGNESTINRDNNKSNAGIADLSSQPQTPSNVNSNKNNHDARKTNDDKATIEDDEQPIQITAPMLGTFYRRSEPSADEFVKVGDKVDKGKTLCIVEAMKMMHEVKADYACTIKEVLTEEGDVVEYGQPLFVVAAAS